MDTNKHANNYRNCVHKLSQEIRMTYVRAAYICKHGLEM
jgi:hypothetical protein